MKTIQFNVNQILNRNHQPITHNKVINIILIQDDCSIEFNTDNISQEPNLTFIADDITFKVYSKA